MCGDAILWSDEVCDDGNDVDGDGCNVDCVESGTVLWEQVVGDIETNNYATAIEADGEGNVYVAWYTANGPSPFVSKYSPDGMLLWRADDDDEGNYYSDSDSDSDSDIDPDGDLVVDRIDDGGGPSFLRITAAGQTGSVIPLPYYLVSGLAVDSTGRLVGVGSDIVAGEELQLTVASFDTDGQLLWADFVSDPDGAAGAAAVAIGSDDRVVVVGSLPEPGLDVRVGWAGAYDSDGNVLWTEVSPDARIWWDVAVDDAGGVYAIGRGSASALLRSYDDVGVEQWTHESDGVLPIDDDWSSVRVAPGGDLVAGGLLSDVDPDGDPIQSWMVRRLDPDGATLWTHLDPDASASMVAVAPSGTIHAAGSMGTQWMVRTYAP